MGETGRLISRHARYILSYSVCYPLQFCVEEWIKNIKKSCYMNMKRLTLAIVIFLGICINIDAQDVVKHVVKRGETLSSIAKTYGTTEDRIRKLNDNLSNFLYVGMELTIPVEMKDNAINNAASQQTDFDKQNTSNQDMDIARFDDNAYPKWSGGTNAAYGFPPKYNKDDTRGSSSILSFSIHVNHHFGKSFYIGSGIGYSSFSNRILMHLGVADYKSTSTSNDMLFLPLEIGSNLYLIKDKVALVPYAGIDITYIVKSTKEEGLGTNKKKESVDLDKRMGVNGRIGLRLNLWGVYLGGSYLFSFDDNYGENNGFPEISFGFLF